MLERIQIQGFRNYNRQDFAPGQGLNLVIGENGSGKTSLLEAIYVLATGRSFRATRPQSLVGAGQERAVLFARIQGKQGVAHRIGMERSRSGLQGLRLDGEDARSLGEVAQVFPVQVFHPGTSEVVSGGPGVRRRYLDWGLFHVEQSFLSLHREFRQALSQRNRLLKTGRASGRELAVWDRQVALASGRIDRLRRDYLARLQPELDRLLRALPELPPVDVELQSGWPEGADLQVLLTDERQRDLARGFTARGAHRADLKLTTEHGPAREVFSRGQTKSLAYVLILAQLKILTGGHGRDCLVLVDDLGSELDELHRAGILQMIAGLEQQVVFTALEADEDLLRCLNRDVRMFHVEHGALSVL